jgi:hypothetical protein
MDGGGGGGDNRVKHEQGMRNVGAAAWKFKLSHYCREDRGPNCIPGCKVLLPDLHSIHRSTPAEINLSLGLFVCLS